MRKYIFMGDIEKLVINISESLKDSSQPYVRRRAKSILQKVPQDNYSLQEFKSKLKAYKLRCVPEFHSELPPDTWLRFVKEPTFYKPLVHKYFSVPDDFLKYLFEFESEQEYERFQASLDSYAPIGLFLIPMKDDFFSEIMERILSYEIVRKRQYQGDAKVGDISHLEINRFTEADSSVANENIWNDSDIFHFNQTTMLNVVLGQSASELIESEKFERKFQQLSLYANKYYVGQFFILFQCPPLPQILKHDRLDILEKLLREVSHRFPYVFRLQARYESDKEIPEDVRKIVFNHFRLLLELPNVELDLSQSLIKLFSELQQIQMQSENQILLNMKPAYFQKMQWRYESDEYVYLQYFTIKTLTEVYAYAIEDIEANTNTYRKDPVTELESTANPDVKASDEIIVNIETLSKKAEDKNVYLNLISSIRNESKGWPEQLRECWVVLTGFEIARNYYQIRKTQEILQHECEGKFAEDFKIVVMTPDYQQNIVIPVNFDSIQQPQLSTPIFKAPPKVTTKPNNKSSVPNFNDVKGLFEEKQSLNDLIKLQSENHSLGLGGILMYGLPGCGKTYLSRAFSNELGRNFFSFSPADVQSVWIGQSQKNIKDIFSQAKAKSPSLLFLDELDSVGFSRNESQAHTDQKATINQLLIELNEIEEENLLVVAATNRLSSLDRALIRSGRFDLKIPIFPPNPQERGDIFGYYLEKLNVELEQKARPLIPIDQVYMNYLGEESIGFTSSDIKLITSQLRIDNLLKKKGANDRNQIVNRIKHFIKFGQRSLTKESVIEFIEECERNDNYSPKIDFLRYEWNI